MASVSVSPGSDQSAAAYVCGNRRNLCHPLGATSLSLAAYTLYNTGGIALGLPGRAPPTPPCIVARAQQTLDAADARWTTGAIPIRLPLMRYLDEMPPHSAITIMPVYPQLKGHGMDMAWPSTWTITDQAQRHSLSSCCSFLTPRQNYTSRRQKSALTAPHHIRSPWKDCEKMLLCLWCTPFLLP